MSKPPIHLSRKYLYVEIWSTPAEVLAERYGISGRGLDRICGYARWRPKRSSLSCTRGSNGRKERSRNGIR